MKTNASPLPLRTLPPTVQTAPARKVDAKAAAPAPTGPVVSASARPFGTSAAVVRTGQVQDGPNRLHVDLRDDGKLTLHTGRRGIPWAGQTEATVTAQTLRDLADAADGAAALSGLLRMMKLAVSG